MAINVKREGTSHEARFKSEALKRGLDVLVPEGDYLPYDVMVVNGEGTKIRVQVKGTSYRAKGSKAHRLLAGCGKTKAPLDPDPLLARREPPETLPKETSETTRCPTLEDPSGGPIV